MFLYGWLCGNVQRCRNMANPWLLDRLPVETTDVWSLAEHEFVQVIIVPVSCSACNPGLVAIHQYNMILLLILISSGSELDL